MMQLAKTMAASKMCVKELCDVLKHFYLILLPGDNKIILEHSLCHVLTFDQGYRLSFELNSLIMYDCYEKLSIGVCIVS